jgi:hypothetical protein
MKSKTEKLPVRYVTWNLKTPESFLQTFMGWKADKERRITSGKNSTISMRRRKDRA